MPGLCEWVGQLCRTRAESPALTCGRYRELNLTTKQYAFARILDQEAVIVVCNNDTADAEMWIRLPLQGGKLTELTSDEEILPEFDQLHITMPGDGVRIFAQSAL